MLPGAPSLPSVPCACCRLPPGACQLSGTSPVAGLLLVPKTQFPKVDGGEAVCV